MARKPLAIPLPAIVEQYAKTGEVPRIFAVVNDAPGVELNPFLVRPAFDVVPEKEDPEVTARRIGLLGRPLGYALVCSGCGKSVRRAARCCPGSDAVRVVTHRAPPTEYGPMVRAEKRILSLDLCQDCGREFEAKTAKACPNCAGGDIKRGGKVLSKVVIHQQLSQFRRACPDRDQRKILTGEKITGGVTADKVFKLAAT